MTSEITSINPAIVVSRPLGPRGLPPAHEWVTPHELRFSNPDGSWGDAQNLIGPTGPDGAAQSFDSTTMLQGSAVAIGVTVVRTMGYYQPGDGGHARYRKKGVIEADQPGDVTDDDGVRWGIAERVIFAEMFGAVGYASKEEAEAPGAVDSTQAIKNAVMFLRRNKRSIWDGLSIQRDAWSSGDVNLGRGFFKITPGQLRFANDQGVRIIGRGSRGRNKAVYGATTLLITTASSQFGIQFYGNAGRDGHIIDLDLCYSNSGYTGALFEQIGAPGSYPIRCHLGSAGVNGLTYMHTALACCRVAWDEFFYPEECVWDGAQHAWLSQDDRLLAIGTGTISGTVLTISAMITVTSDLPDGGAFGVDVSISGAGVTAGTTITEQLSGTPGGAGQYRLNISQTVASPVTITGAISFGGSNTNFINCVSYNITQKHYRHLGNRARYNVQWTGGIINPISVGCLIGIDCRNVKGTNMVGLDWSGSVGDSAANGWIYLENCTYNIVGGKMGIGVSAGTISNCAGSITGLGCETNDGFNISGGAFVEHGNEFTDASKAFTIDTAVATHVQLGPSKFGGRVGASYQVGGSGSFGRLNYASELDNSINKFLATAIGVEIMGAGRKTFADAGLNTISILDTGRTLVFSGGAAQTGALPAAVVGCEFKIIHIGGASLTIAASSGALRTGTGTAKTAADIAGSVDGGSLHLKCISTGIWFVMSSQGSWTFS